MKRSLDDGEIAEVEQNDSIVSIILCNIFEIFNDTKVPTKIEIRNRVNVTSNVFCSFFGVDVIENEEKEKGIFSNGLCTGHFCTP